VEELAPGATLDPGPIQAPGEAPGAAILIEATHSEEAHAIRYRARQGGSSLLVTVFDDAIVAQDELCDALERNLTAARGVSHRNLLPCYGFRRTTEQFIVAREDPRCTTVHEFILKRMAKGERIDLGLSCKIAAQVCDALSVLHRVVPHGYVTASNVLINRKGRVFLSGAGEGQAIPFAPRFHRYMEAGLFPANCRELLESPHEPLTVTDVFLVGTLVVEMISGHAAEGIQASLTAAGLDASHPLNEFLERTVDPDPNGRPTDIVDFRKRLIAASRARTADRLAPPPPPSTPGSFESGVPTRATPPPAPPPRPPTAGYDMAPPAPPPPMDPDIGIPTIVTGPATFSPLPSDEAPPPLPKPAPRAAATPPPAPPAAPRAKTSAPMVGQNVPPPTDWQNLDQATASLTNASLDDTSTRLHSFGSAAAAPAVVPESDALSELGLDLGTVEDVAGRLETIDGESGLLPVKPRGDASVVVVDDAPRPAALSGDGYFGGFGQGEDISIPLGSPGDSPSAAPAAFAAPSEPASTKAPPPNAPGYMLTRGGVDQGPFSFLQLSGMARRGELQSTETVTRRTDDHSAMAVDYPELREIFNARIERERRRASETGAHKLPADSKGSSPGSSKAQTGHKKSKGTLLWILATLAIFGAAAWVLWKRSGG
jgi:hypothetical protein